MLKKMALRYSYGPYGWGLDPAGKYRTPQEIGKWFGYNEAGYDQLHFEKYSFDPNWTGGNLETSVHYSKDPFGNYYQDPNGPYSSMNMYDRRGRFIRGVQVPNIDEFKLPYDSD